jgi:predicted nucleic acid-binding protein
VIVVDASAVIDGLLNDGRAAERIAGDELAAPHVLDAEVGHALRRLDRGGHIDAGVASGALDGLRALEIERYGHIDLLSPAWQLRGNLSFYEGLYVALASALDVTLVTLDARLAGAPGTTARVEVLPAG